MGRHKRLAEAVGGLVSRWRGVVPLFEQQVPHWDRESRRAGVEPGTVEHAVLDVEYVGKIFLTERLERGFAHPVPCTGSSKVHGPPPPWRACTCQGFVGI